MTKRVRKTAMFLGSEISSEYVSLLLPAKTTVDSREKCKRQEENSERKKEEELVRDPRTRHLMSIRKRTLRPKVTPNMTTEGRSGRLIASLDQKVVLLTITYWK